MKGLKELPKKRKESQSESDNDEQPEYFVV